MKQVILPFLPGYMFDGSRLMSTGLAIPPTQHVNAKTGEVIYYCRPLWKDATVPIGVYIRHKGLIDYMVSHLQKDQ